MIKVLNKVLLVLSFSTKILTEEDFRIKFFLLYNFFGVEAVLFLSGHIVNA